MRQQMDLTIPVIGIVRGIFAADFFGELMNAVFGASLQAIEVTCNTKESAGPL
jgi:2-keto-3-deoxy-6-phosphogluconate aldolase